jgi:hypothetical protein
LLAARLEHGQVTLVAVLLDQWQRLLVARQGPCMLTMPRQRLAGEHQQHVLAGGVVLGGEPDAGLLQGGERRLRLPQHDLAFGDPQPRRVDVVASSCLIATRSASRNAANALSGNPFPVQEAELIRLGTLSQSPLSCMRSPRR